MNEAVREMTREELVARINEFREANEKVVALNHKLMAENEELKEELQAERQRVKLATEDNFHELRYRAGVIYGLKYALRCNGVSGGEVEVDERD